MHRSSRLRIQDVDEETLLQIALAESVRTAKEEQTKRDTTAPQVSHVFIGWVIK